MKALSGLDGAFLHIETPDTPMHVGSLHVFELPPHHAPAHFHAEVRKMMAKRMHLAPIFQRKLASMPLQFANPVWVHEPDVDLDYHVQHVTLPPPGSPAQLEDCAARLHAELLDRSRPLWRLYVIDGLPGRQAGYYIKVHHAVLDGQAGVLLAKALFDVTPEPAPVPRRRKEPAEHPGLLALTGAALRHDAAQYVKLLRRLPDVARTLVGVFSSNGEGRSTRAGRLGSNFTFGPRTALNVPIDAERGFSGVSVPLESLKRIAQAHDAKLNDVVLALCSGALRRYLQARGGLPKKPLIAAMPISLREAGNTDYGTQATMLLVNLHTQLADPRRRLRAIRDGAGAVKALARRASGIMPTDFPSIAVPWVLQGLAALYARSGLTRAIAPLANLVISNVPGPPAPLYAAGARMTTYWPMSIVEHGLGLNITVMSYAGAMGFGFTTARRAVPDARELSSALLLALEELSATARTRRVKVPAAAKPGARGARGGQPAAPPRRPTSRAALRTSARKTTRHAAAPSQR